MKIKAAVVHEKNGPFILEDINGAFEKSHGSDVIKAVLRME